MLTPLSRNNPPQRIDQQEGGCWLACIAMLTGIALDHLPPALLTAEDPDRYSNNNFNNRVMSAVHQHGWTLARIGTRCPRGFAIMSGESPRDAGVRHSVIAFDGTVWHDPHPSRAGLGNVDEYEIVVPVLSAWMLNGDGETVPWPGVQ